jgi:hypothetical protein
MRTELIAYIKGLNLGRFTLSEEYPRNESGQDLYLKNQRKIYVDAEQYTEEPLINTLGSLSIHSKTTSVTVYFSVDGKTVPNNYDEIVLQLRAGKDIGSGFRLRTAAVSTSYVQDLLITEIEYQYTNVN